MFQIQIAEEALLEIISVDSYHESEQIYIDLYKFSGSRPDQMQISRSRSRVWSPTRMWGHGAIHVGLVYGGGRGCPQLTTRTGTNDSRPAFSRAAWNILRHWGTTNKDWKARKAWLTDPVPSMTPFGVRKIPEPMMVPTMMATPLTRVIFFFSLISPPSSEFSRDLSDPFLFATILRCCCYYWKTQIFCQEIARLLLICR